MIVYQTSPVVTDGGQQEVIVSDWDTQNLLEKILIELRIANLHNDIMSDNTFSDSDVTTGD